MGIWGWGTEGRAALDAMVAHGGPASCLVATEQPPRPGDEPPQGVDLATGTDALGALSGCELVVRSPGIGLYTDAVERLRRAGVELTTGTNLWFDALAARPHRGRVVAITGSKGKSTTTATVAHLLAAIGQDRVRVAGNIGTALLTTLDDLDATQLWVLELSSYQLADLEHAPDIAVITNLFADHAEWHGSVDRYLDDKLRVAAAPTTAVIANAADARLTARLAGRPRVAWFNAPQAIHSATGVVWQGDHPLWRAGGGVLAGPGGGDCAAAALTTLKVLGHDPEDVAGHLDTFPGLPHRWQTVGDRDGVAYVDDSAATTPEAATAALGRVTTGHTVLIVGGLDRDQDYRALARAAAAHPRLRAVVAVPDNGPRILAEIARAGARAERHAASDLAAAVRRARGLAQPGDTVLLSPGAPSYDHFTAFPARGAAFAALALG